MPDSNLSCWLDSDSCDNPGDSTLTQLNTSLFLLDSAVCTDPTQIQNLVTWLNFDSTNLSQSWVKADLPTTYHVIPTIIWPKVVDRGCGGAVDCYCRLVLSLYRYRQINAKSLRFLLRTISDSTLTQQNSIDSTLTQMAISMIKLSTHIPGFHGRLDYDSTHFSQSRVKFDSWLMSRAQPW